MKLHHLGFVVQNIEQYEKRLIHNGKVKEIIDPIQKAKLSLYKGFGDYYIELIEPLSEDSFTWNFCTKTPNTYHHSCFEVDSIEQVSDLAQNMRLIHLRGPIPALLFDNWQVVFYYDRNKNIIEFLINYT
jgi:methylmalonyl-CoA/ethylmalonyl-CoA epimerase